MSTVSLQFLGCGDAFGSGGKFNTCFLVQSDDYQFLIDCGASALISMKKYGVNPENIESIILSHLHGDHFGGLPFLIRESQIVAERQLPLIIIGPTGTRERLLKALEVFFPGSTENSESFDFEILEYTSFKEETFDGIKLLTYPAIHSKGTNPHSLKIEFNDKIIAYSGDGEWNENILKISNQADLFICECYAMEPKKKNHMNYHKLIAEAPQSIRN